MAEYGRHNDDMLCGGGGGGESVKSNREENGEWTVCFESGSVSQKDSTRNSKMRSMLWNNEQRRVIVR